MSAYGPNKDVPRLLFGGELEQSPEEMRYRYYLAKAQGNEDGGVSCQLYATNATSLLNVPETSGGASCTEN
jgi:nucleoporin NUP42